MLLDVVLVKVPHQEIGILCQSGWLLLNSFVHSRLSETGLIGFVVTVTTSLLYFA